MSKLSDLANAIASSSPKIKAFCVEAAAEVDAIAAKQITMQNDLTALAARIALIDARVTKLEAPVVTPPPPPPPTTATKMWGFSLSPPGGNWANLTEAAGRQQLQEAKNLGMNCPRITGHAWAAQACLDLGFEFFIPILGAGTNFPDPTSVINYCKQWGPKVIIAPGNELNNPGSPWTPATLAPKHIALKKAMVAAGLPNKLLLSSISQAGPPDVARTPHQWCLELAAAGCKYPEAFDIADYHVYAADPIVFDRDYLHAWTPDANGVSSQSAFGNPPYIISEFNLHTADANAKAAAIKRHMDHIKTDPKCLGGMVYTILNTTDAGTNWGLVTDSYVKIQPPWDTFKAGTVG